ncbi:MAG: hypothetical protein GY774_22250 [Planctomycetes bacterium]|nr:hypothetical protein [Planctomycetota bacterium]
MIKLIKKAERFTWLALPFLLLSHISAAIAFAPFMPRFKGTEAYGMEPMSVLGLLILCYAFATVGMRQVQGLILRAQARSGAPESGTLIPLRLLHYIPASFAVSMVLLSVEAHFYLRTDATYEPISMATNITFLAALGGIALLYLDAFIGWILKRKQSVSA